MSSGKCIVGKFVISAGEAGWANGMMERNKRVR